MRVRVIETVEYDFECDASNLEEAKEMWANVDCVNDHFSSVESQEFREIK